jgi:hypothetical protein
MSTPLDELFGEKLPGLLRAQPAPAAPPSAETVVGFVATGAPESGSWVVRVNERSGRRTTAEDRPDVVVEAGAAVLALLFTGALDVEAAIAQGALRVIGERAALDRLRAALR